MGLTNFRPTKVQRIGAVLAIASAFLILELVLGFTTHSLALVADAFHIMSDIIGYAVAMLATKYAASQRTPPAQYTFGYQRAETVGAFFNGAFLTALGVSALLQSIERFTDPSGVTDPVLIMAVGAAGIGSNILMLAVLGGHAHGGHSHGGNAGEQNHIDNRPRSHEDGLGSAHELSEAHKTPLGDAPMSEAPSAAAVIAGADGTVASPDHSLLSALGSHDGHAHARLLDSKTSRRSTHDLNVLGVLIHILGDALNSVAVIISGAKYKVTGSVYADPIASLFVAFMIMGTAYPLLRRSLRQLLDAAPERVDVQGVKEDIERLAGMGSVHDLRIWSLDDKNIMASLHLSVPSDSLKDYDMVADNVRSCLHLWGIHATTIQPDYDTIVACLYAVPMPLLASRTRARTRTRTRAWPPASSVAGAA